MPRTLADDDSRAETFVRTWASGQVGKLSSAVFNRRHARMEPAALASVIAQKAAAIASERRRGRYSGDLSPAAAALVAAIPRAVERMLASGQISLERTPGFSGGPGSHAVMLRRHERIDEDPAMRGVAYARGHAARVAPGLGEAERVILAEMFRRCSELRRPRSTRDGHLLVQGMAPGKHAILFPQHVVLGEDGATSLTAASLLVVDQMSGHMEWLKLREATIVSDEGRMVVSVSCEAADTFHHQPVLGIVPQIRLDLSGLGFTMHPNVFARFGARAVSAGRFATPLRRPYPGSVRAGAAMLYAILPRGAWKAAQTLPRVHKTEEWNLFCPPDPVQASRRWQAMTSMPLISGMFVASAQAAAVHASLAPSSQPCVFELSRRDAQECQPASKPDLGALIGLVDEAKPLMPALQARTGMRQGVLKRLLPQRWQRTGAAIHGIVAQGSDLSFLDAVPPEAMPKKREQWKSVRRVSHAMSTVAQSLHLQPGEQVLSTRAWRHGWVLPSQDGGQVHDFVSGVVRAVAEHAWHASGNEGHYWNTDLARYVARMISGGAPVIYVEDMIAASDEWHTHSRRLARRMGEINQAAAARRLGLEIQETPSYLAPGGDWEMPPEREGATSLGSMRWLRNIADLEAESAVMGHCVYSYGHHAMRGSMLAAVRAADGTMSTVEFVMAPVPEQVDGSPSVPDPVLRVQQNRAESNEPPSPDCHAIVAAWLRQVGSRLDRVELDSQIRALRKFADLQNRVSIHPEDYARTLGSVLDLHRRYFHQDYKKVTAEDLIEIARGCPLPRGGAQRRTAVIDVPMHRPRPRPVEVLMGRDLQDADEIPF